TGIAGGPNWSAGVILPTTGELVVRANNTNTPIYKINLTTRVATSMATTLTEQIADFAYSPLTDKLYTVTNISRDLYAIDPATGTTTLIGGTGIPSVVGAMYADSFGNIYGIGVDALLQPQYYQFNLATGLATVLNTAQASTNVFDGTSTEFPVAVRDSICIGSALQLAGSTTPAASNPWVSSNPAIANVSNTGLVTAVSPGATIVLSRDANGCDSLYPITVGTYPNVNAGMDLSICQLDTIATAFVNGAAASGYTSLVWSSYNGTGTFANNTTATALSTTTYDPTTVDHNTNPPGANLVLTATGATGCVSSDTMRLNIRTTYTWTGATSEDFGTAGNWLLGCVPPQHASINFASNVVNVCKLDQHYYLTNITNDSNAVAAKNILDLNGKRLTVEGNLSFPIAAATGKIKANAATDTLEFKGTAAQTIPTTVFVGKTVSNMRIDNASGVTEQDSIFITYTLQPVTGTLATAGQLVLRSNAAQTARVTPIANTATTGVSGNVIVERFIPSDTNRAWRILSACVQDATAPTIFQSWQENMRATTGSNYQSGYGTFVSAPGVGITNGFDSSSNTTSLQYWNGMALVTPATTNNASADKITSNGGAWFLFVRGDKNVRPEMFPAQGITTLRQTGILNQGDVTVGQAGTSYSLIPNPYPSPVDLDAVGTANNLSTFHIWDATMNSIGGYRTITKTGMTYTVTPSKGTIADDATLRYLNSGQGFLIPGNMQLNFTEDMKAGTTSVLNVYKTASLDQQLEMDLFNVNNATIPQQVDGVRLYLDGSYSNAVVANEDVTKPENINENLAIGEGTSNLVISKRQEPTATDTVQLKFWKTTLGNYKMVLKPHNFGATLSAELIDKYTNTVTPISTSGSTDYPFTITNATGSWNVNRFIITITQNNPLALAGIKLTATKQGKEAKLTWNVANQKGIAQYEVERSVNGKDFANVQVLAKKSGDEATTYTWMDMQEQKAKTYYRIKGVSASSEYVYSNIAQLSDGTATGRIHVYPNPVTAQTFTVILSDLVKGTYTVGLYDGHGQQVQTSIVTHAGNTASYEVTISSELAAGNYMLKLTQGNNMIFTQKLMITKP
ncbi:MAG TPA: T9SS type A sorting domain-containing protein, partial [Flavipsychrobacter sp.]|nr:T9SS type A sorting domain-containing protein [Flavipsychrobacter sp.]